MELRHNRGGHRRGRRCHVSNPPTDANPPFHGKITRLEVRWDDWVRKDGSKTTWNEPTAIKCDQWRRKQRKHRRFAAQESLEIDLISTTDIHNVETYLAHEGHEEKRQRSDDLPKLNLLSKLAKIQAKQEEHDRDKSSYTENQGSSSSSYSKRNNQRESTRQKSEISLANSVRGTSTLSRPPQWSLSSASPASSTSLSFKPNLFRSTTIDSTSSLPTSDCRKGKLRSHDSDEFDVLPSSTPKVPKHNNLPGKKVQVKQACRSDSEDETEMTVSPSLENPRMPKRRRLSMDPTAQ